MEKERPQFGLTLRRSHSGLSFSGPESPVFLNQPEWRPDINHCEECNKRFDFFTRRHHCRRCGRCLCERCSRDKAALKRMRFLDLVRQCNQCLQISIDENQKLSKMGILAQRVSFIDTSDKPVTVSVDEFFTKIQINQTKQLKSINLAELISARILVKTRHEQKYAIGFCMATQNEQFELLLPENPPKTDMIWLKCLRIMFDLIFDTAGDFEAAS